MLREFLKSDVAILLTLEKIGYHLDSRTSGFNHLHNCFYLDQPNSPHLVNILKPLDVCRRARAVKLRLHFADPDLTKPNLQPAQSG